MNHEMIAKIAAQAFTLTHEEKLELNRILVDNIRRTQKLNSAKVAAGFNIGDKVSFDAGPRKGGKITIRIESFSRDGTKVKGPVVAGYDSGRGWSVSGALCTKVA